MVVIVCLKKFMIYHTASSQQQGTDYNPDYLDKEQVCSSHLNMAPEDIHMITIYFPGGKKKQFLSTQCESSC